MKVIILAGGFGTRLYPLTWGKPKSMVPLANKPFLARFLSWLNHYDVSDVILALNHLPEMIQEYFGDGSRWGVNLRYLLEETPLGSGGAIKNAEELLSRETFLVLNGDILTDLDLGRMTEFHKSRGAAMTISLAEVDDPSGFGVVDMEADGRLGRFVEKPPREEAPSRYINAGAWLFEPKMLDKMPPRGQAFSVEREFWPVCLQEGIPIYGYPGDCYWLDIGTIPRYLQAHRDILEGKIDVDIEEKSVGEHLWIAESAEVDPGAKIEGPAIIGRNSKIAAGARISETVVGRGCRVEKKAEVRDSVLWPEVEIGAECNIAHAVIGSRQCIECRREVRETALEEDGMREPI